MRSLRTLSAFALIALLALVGAGPAAAKKKPKADAFAAKFHLTGSWKTKDADKDGLKNLKEFKLGTNPKSADSDNDGLKDADELASGNDPTDRDTDDDGIKDGSEHAGVVTAFDGETVTVREFAGGRKVTATVDTECFPADDDVDAEDSSYDDDESFDDEDDLTAAAAQAGDVDDEDLDDEDIDADASSCDDADELEKGLVLSGAEYETDGATTFLLDYDVA
jgi:hypothetical protein